LQTTARTARHATVAEVHADSSVRPVRADEFALLPAVEAAADTVFAPFDRGAFPGPGTPAQFAAALVVLVAGDPPVGLCRIDPVGDGAHLDQLSVHPEHGRRGIGRTLLRAGIGWAEAHDFRELTLATYRDVPWNGPFYASEGFVEIAPADDWLVAHALAPEDPVMARYGARIVMARPLGPLSPSTDPSSESSSPGGR
jgi:GNAT superfamily N-acetyltransferase